MVDLWPYISKALPGLFAIYLVVIADFAGGYLKRLTHQYLKSRQEGLMRIRQATGAQWTQADTDIVVADDSFITDLVSDAVARVNFLSAMFAGILAAFTLTSVVQEYGMIVGVSVLVLFVPLLYYVANLGPAELVRLDQVKFNFWGSDRQIRQRPYLLLRNVIIVINVLLLSGVEVGQYYSLHATTTVHGSEPAIVPSAGVAHVRPSGS